MAFSKNKPRELSIKEKVMVIQQKESEGKSQRELAKIFGVSKTQIQNTLKRKIDILAAYGNNLPNNRKRVRVVKFEEDIDSLTYLWFQRARSLNLPISGPLIQETALSFAKSLKKDGFKASNGWLSRFKSRHSISQAVICGESGCVDKEVIRSWKSHLPDITTGYATCDIYDMDKSAIFFRALLDKTLEKGAATNLNQVLQEYLKMQNKISAESDNEEKLPEENEASSSMDKCSKSSLKSVRDTLKCVEDIKSFLLERGAVHLLTPLYEIEKGLCEMSTSSLGQKSIYDFLNSSD